MKIYTEEQVRKIYCIAFLGGHGKYIMDFEEDVKLISPIELPSNEEIEKIAQWVIDNRYAKSELNKVSDFEMYHHIIKLIKEQILNQNK